MQLRVGVRECVVAVLGLAEELLQVSYPLVLALAIGPLRRAVLGSTTLLGTKKKPWLAPFLQACLGRTGWGVRCV